MLRTGLGVIRSAIAFPVVGFSTIVFGAIALILGKVAPTSRAVLWVMRAWGWVFIKVAGVRDQIEGLEHLEGMQPSVFVANHLSGIDPPYHIARLQVQIRFLAKKELFRIPLFGSAMRSIGIIETDRQAHASAHRTINTQVARVVERGHNLIIYPEGTRSRTAELKPFKKGAFRIAVDNGMPIVPVAISGTDRVWPKGGKLIYGGRVRMVIHEPIPVAGLGPGDLDALRDKTHAIIESTYEEIRR